MAKIKVIKGDVSIDGLGISEMDKSRLIEDTNVVFHCAANVRFDQEIEGAVNMVRIIYFVMFTVKKVFQRVCFART